MIRNYLSKVYHLLPLLQVLITMVVYRKELFKRNQQKMRDLKGSSKIQAIQAIQAISTKDERAHEGDSTDIATMLDYAFLFTLSFKLVE